MWPGHFFSAGLPSESKLQGLCLLAFVSQGPSLGAGELSPCFSLKEVVRWFAARLVYLLVVSYKLPAIDVHSGLASNGPKRDTYLQIPLRGK